MEFSIDANKLNQYSPYFCQNVINKEFETANFLFNSKSEWDQKWHNRTIKKQEKINYLVRNEAFLVNWGVK